jgi:hypothetical protein
MAVTLPVASLLVKLYIPDQQSAVSGDDSAHEIGAAIPVLLPRIDNPHLFTGAGDQILRCHQLPLPYLNQKAFLYLIYDALFCATATI